MVLYRLFVLAWIFESVFSLGAPGSVSCWQSNCLPCRTFIKQMVWERNISDADCNCTNWNQLVNVHRVQTLNATSGQCMNSEWTEFGLLETGLEGRNVPFFAEDVVTRPARVYVKAKAKCSSRRYNFTQGVVRVHGHFGIRLTTEVYYMINGSWIWAEHLDGDFFNDEFGADPFHEFIFDLRRGSTAIYYNYRQLVLTELHADKARGGIQLDGASAPWLNWLAVYDDQCEFSCQYWKCDEQGNCDCVDIVPTSAPVHEVEDAGLLVVVLVIMITNIFCLVFFTVFWRCYGKSVREDERRSKRGSSFYSARGSSFRRSSAFSFRFSHRASERRPSERRNSERISATGVGLGIRDADQEEKLNEQRARKNQRRRRNSKSERSREGPEPTAPAKPKPQSVQPEKDPEQPKAPKPNKKPRAKKEKKARVPSITSKAKRKESETDMVPIDSMENGAKKKKKKKKPHTPKSQDSNGIEIVEASKQKKKNAKTKTSAEPKTKKHKKPGELNHEKQVTKKKKINSNENPSTVGLVHNNKRKDSEPKAEQQSFSLVPDSSHTPGAKSSIALPPGAKTSIARSSSSSDNMNKQETGTSKTVSPDSFQSDREGPVDMEGKKFVSNTSSTQTAEELDDLIGELYE